MSIVRHAVVRGPSFTGLGYLPDLHPFHQLALHTGMSFKTSGSRMKPETCALSIDNPPYLKSSKNLFIFTHKKGKGANRVV